jgi:hypothetical protein
MSRSRPGAGGARPRRPVRRRRPGAGGRQLPLWADVLARPRRRPAGRRGVLAVGRPGAPQTGSGAARVCRVHLPRRAGERCPTGQARDERYHVPFDLDAGQGRWRIDLSVWLRDLHGHVADWHTRLRDTITDQQRLAVLRIKDVWHRLPSYPTRSAAGRSTPPCCATASAARSSSHAGSPPTTSNLGRGCGGNQRELMLHAAVRRRAASVTSGKVTERGTLTPDHGQGVADGPSAEAVGAGAEAAMAEPASPMTFKCPLAVRSTVRRRAQGRRRSPWLPWTAGRSISLWFNGRVLLASRVDPVRRRTRSGGGDLKDHCSGTERRRSR